MNASAPIEPAPIEPAPIEPAPTEPAPTEPAPTEPAPTGTGTREDPWVLRTPPGTSEYTLHRDESADPPLLVCTVGKTVLTYRLRCIEDLTEMLREADDWVPLGSADEQKPAAEGSVEAWGRSETNPVGGWYGMRKGYRGRFAMYVPPLLEALGLARLEHNPRGNRMRAV